jgi:hypothetical protein
MDRRTDGGPSRALAPSRAMFDTIAEGLWTTARSQRFWGIETGTRMTVARLEDAGLFVHCPAALYSATRAAVDALGEVRAVVSSSLFHHLYAGEWMRAYPKATFCPCPGLAAKRADLSWGPVLGDAPLSLWEGTLDQARFDARFEREVVFFHRASKTMICADALLNLSKHPSLVTRAAAQLMRNTAPGKGWLEYFAVTDWRLGRRQVDRILEWDFDRVLLAHGALVERDGREVMRDAYRWL